MHRGFLQAAAVIAVLSAGLAAGPPAAAQGAEPMYNISRWGDYTTMTVVMDPGGYSEWPNEFYHQFDCGLAGGFVGMSVTLDDPMTGNLSYMTDTSKNTVRWIGYNTATGPGGGTYMVVTAVADTTDCNWPASGTVLTQWYQGDNFDRQPDITNRAIDPTWFLDTGNSPPTDPAEFWGKNLDHTGWGLTSENPPIVVQAGDGLDSGYGSIDLHVLVSETTTTTTTVKPAAVAATPKPSTPTEKAGSDDSASKAVGGSGSGSGAGAAGGGGGGGAAWIVTIGIIILILATFAAGTSYRRKKRADNMFQFTEELSSLALDLSPTEKQKLVSDFKKQKDKSVYVDYLKGLRDYNMGTRDTPPDPPDRS